MVGLRMHTLHTQTPHKYEMLISPHELQARFKEMEFFERAALEQSTQRCMASVVRCYVKFCESARVEAFPCSYTSLGLYLVQYCHRFGHTTRTIPTILSHLKRANRQYAVTWLDTASEHRLEDLIAGLKKYDRAPPMRKLPITHVVMAAIQQAATMTDLRHYQHVVMSRLAREALLRGAELVQLKIGDLLWAPDGKTVTVVIHRSKANKTGPPEHVVIADHGPSSAVAFLREYYKLMGLQQSSHAASHPLWPTVTAYNHVLWSRATTKNEFVALARFLLRKAGYPANKYAGHSYRSGGATDLWDSHRCRPLAIKLHGRWKSEAYRLYIRDNPEKTAEEVAHALAFFDEATSD